eukprot:COSAG01_NODE_604_length_14894_cov_24.503211_16_plen_45_part_00
MPMQAEFRWATSLSPPSRSPTPEHAIVYRTEFRCLLAALQAIFR